MEENSPSLAGYRICGTILSQVVFCLVIMLTIIHKNILKSKRTLLDYIKLQLDPNRKLVKLSLCWVCSKEIVDKYKVIQRSIKQNAKYYFEDGKEVE